MVLSLPKLQFLNPLLHSTDLFQCFYWQTYTAISNNDPYLSFFHLSYVFSKRSDSVQRGPTVKGKKVPWFFGQYKR